MKQKLKLIFLLYLNPVLSQETQKAENIGFLFAHGLGGNRGNILYYTNFILPDYKYCKTFDFPEVNEQNKINDKKVNLAQDNDLKTLKMAHDEFLAQKENKPDKVVCMGLSRGGAAILNYAATHPNNIKALVVEAPFDKLKNVLHELADRYGLGWIPGFKRLFRNIIFSKYPSYDKNGKHPISLVHQIPKNIPILIVHSKEDELISYKSSQRLFHKLRKHGHKDVYLLILNKGKHAKYHLGDDSEKYQETVHAFYKRYGIPYDPTLAQKGKFYLNTAKNYF